MRFLKHINVIHETITVVKEKRKQIYMLDIYIYIIFYILGIYIYILNKPLRNIYKDIQSKPEWIK